MLPKIGPEADRIADDRMRCGRLHEFVRRAWHVLEPVTKFVDGWHIDAVCQHLEAVSAGQITRLQINEPPGCMKSLIASVLWEAWEWGPLNMPGLRYLTTSYNEDYAKRDARKMRDLVLSEWYQARWPVQLVRVGETSFENTQRGGREAKPFGSLTAGRGNRVIIDDPHSTETAESEADRARAARIFRESVPSRLNDPRTDAIVVIMHRLHRQDVCGIIESLGLPYERLILPMEFESDRRCVTSIGFRDPRSKDGELLFPEMVPRPVLEATKQTLTSYAYAGQYQQRPAPREGGMFKRHWFKIVKRAPENNPGARRVRKWDLAASLPKAGTDPDWTVGLKMAVIERRYYVEDVTRFRETANAVRTSIRATAIADGADVRILLPQDPGQAGKDQAQNLVAMLAGYNVHAERETGKKDTRAEPFAAQCEAGNVFLVEGPWNEAFIDELCNFPLGHDDQVDCASGAFSDLAGNEIPEMDFSGIAMKRVNPHQIG